MLLKLILVLSIFYPAQEIYGQTQGAKGSTVLPQDEAASEIVEALSLRERLPILFWSDSLKVFQLNIKERCNKKDRIVFVTSLFIFIDKQQRISFAVTRDKVTKG